MYRRSQRWMLIINNRCWFYTPLHIVPEWYFLCQYAMLKAVPNKNAGFIILFTSIFTYFYFMRSVSMSFFLIVFTCSRFNGILLSFWFLSLLSFVWIGGQFPQDNFLSYGRILTLHYYFLLICILFTSNRNKRLWVYLFSLLFLFSSIFY